MDLAEEEYRILVWHCTEKSSSRLLQPDDDDDQTTYYWIALGQHPPMTLDFQSTADQPSFIANESNHTSLLHFVLAVSRLLPDDIDLILVSDGGNNTRASILFMVVIPEILSLYYVGLHIHLESIETHILRMSSTLDIKHTFFSEVIGFFLTTELTDPSLLTVVSRLCLSLRFDLLRETMVDTWLQFVTNFGGCHPSYLFGKSGSDDLKGLAVEFLQHKVVASVAVDKWNASYIFRGSIQNMMASLTSSIDGSLSGRTQPTLEAPWYSSDTLGLWTNPLGKVLRSSSYLVPDRITSSIHSKHNSRQSVLWNAVDQSLSGHDVYVLL